MTEDSHLRSLAPGTLGLALLLLLFGGQEAVAQGADPDLPGVAVMATIAFARGVDFEDKKEIEKAIEQYQQALEIHPGHQDAQKALARLQGGGEGR